MVKIVFKYGHMIFNCDRKHSNATVEGAPTFMGMLVMVVEAKSKCCWTRMLSLVARCLPARTLWTSLVSRGEIWNGKRNKNTHMVLSRYSSLVYGDIFHFPDCCVALTSFLGRSETSVSSPWGYMWTKTSSHCWMAISLKHTTMR